MQEHDKSILMLIVIGGLIGMSKLLVSKEPLSVRLLIGRTILGSATSLIAGVVIMQIPNVSPLALIGLASSLGILGSTFIEEYLKNRVKNLGG